MSPSRMTLPPRQYSSGALRTRPLRDTLAAPLFRVVLAVLMAAAGWQHRRKRVLYPRLNLDISRPQQQVKYSEASDGAVVLTCPLGPCLLGLRGLLLHIAVMMLLSWCLVLTHRLLPDAVCLHAAVIINKQAKNLNKTEISNGCEQTWLQGCIKYHQIFKQTDQIITRWHDYYVQYFGECFWFREDLMTTCVEMLQKDCWILGLCIAAFVYIFYVWVLMICMTALLLDSWLYFEM